MNVLLACIICVQSCGGCSVLWGCLVPCGDMMSTVEGHDEYRGDILRRNIMMHVGDIMSTVAGIQYHGGYHLL